MSKGLGFFSNRKTFALRLRSPGWTRGRPVPSDLCRYERSDDVPVVVRVNGAPVHGTMAGPALGMLGAFKLRAGSPAINAGVSVTNNGGRDFWEGTLYVGAPDIGAHEVP